MRVSVVTVPGRKGLLLRWCGVFCCGLLPVAQAQEGVVGTPDVRAAAPVSTGSVAVAAGRTGIIRRKHLHFQHAAAENAFLQLAASRQRTREELTVLARLLSEKQMETQRFESDLEKEFAVRANGNYHYSEESAVVYELILNTTDGEDAGATNSPTFTRREHRRLDDEGKRRRFLSLVSAKQLASEGERVLGLLQKEKRIELAGLQEALQEQFSVAPEKSYEYDRAERQIYELVPAPGQAPGGDEEPEAETSKPATERDGGERPVRKVAPSQPGKKRRPVRPLTPPTPAVADRVEPSSEQSALKSGGKPEKPHQKGDPE